MAEFDENKLREEEYNAGFNPNDEGDETFLLEKLDKYEGAIPDFVADETVIADDEQELETNEQMQAQEIQHPITDSPNNQEDYPSDEFASLSDDSSADELPESDFTPIQTVEDDDLIPIEQIEDEPEIINIETEPQEFDSDAAPENVQIDDELRKLLQSELENSKSKRSTLSKKEPEIPEEELQTSGVLEIDELEETQIIDITDIEADRPSTYNPQEESSQPVEEVVEQAAAGMNISKHSKKPAVKPDDTGEVKEKKRKKPFPWRLASIPAAAAVLLIAVGIASFILFFDSGSSLYLFKIPEYKDTAQLKITAENIKKRPKKNEPIVKDTVQQKQINIPDTLKVTEAKKEIKQKEPEKKPEQQKIVPKTETLTKKEPDNSKVIVQKEAPKPKKPKVKKEAPPKMEPIEKKETKKTDYAYKEKEIVPVAKDTKSNEVYTIQVYSSPSREDAEEWIERLLEMNIAQPFISSQKIRDKIWYRVRFGNFNTKEEARTVALKYGFAQSWIDRIK